MYDTVNFIYGSHSFKNFFEIILEGVCTKQDFINWNFVLNRTNQILLLGGCGHTSNKLTRILFNKRIQQNYSSALAVCNSGHVLIRYSEVGIFAELLQVTYKIKFVVAYAFDLLKNYTFQESDISRYCFQTPSLAHSVPHIHVVDSLENRHYCRSARKDYHFKQMYRASNLSHRFHYSAAELTKDAFILTINHKSHRQLLT